MVQNIQILRLDGLQSQALKASIKWKFICLTEELKMKPQAKFMIRKSGWWVMIVIGCSFFKKSNTSPNTPKIIP